MTSLSAVPIMWQCHFPVGRIVIGDAICRPVGVFFLLHENVTMQSMQIFLVFTDANADTDRMFRSGRLHRKAPWDFSALMKELGSRERPTGLLDEFVAFHSHVGCGDITDRDRFDQQSWANQPIESRP